MNSWKECTNRRKYSDMTYGDDVICAVRPPIRISAKKGF